MDVVVGAGVGVGVTSSVSVSVSITTAVVVVGVTTSVMVMVGGPPAQPVMYVTHSVGMWHGSHSSSQGPTASSAVVVSGQQSVEQGIVTLDLLMYRGQTWSGSGGGQEGFGQEAVFREG